MTLTNTTTLDRRARWAIYAAWAVIACSVLMLLLELLEAAGLFDPTAAGTAGAAIYGLLALGYTVAFVSSVVLVAMWIHRAHANLHDLGHEGLEFTPGWAVGWYFIPFANLVKPFQAMRELRNRSLGDDDGFNGATAPELTVWWATWIVGNILSNISTRMALSEPGIARAAAGLGALSSVLTIVCAWYLIGLIARITNAQANGMAAAEVFA